MLARNAISGEEGDVSLRLEGNDRKITNISPSRQYQDLYSGGSKSPRRYANRHTVAMTDRDGQVVRWVENQDINTRSVNLIDDPRREFLKLRKNLQYVFKKLCKK